MIYSSSTPMRSFLIHLRGGLWAVCSVVLCLGSAGASGVPAPADANGLTTERLDCGLEVWVLPRDVTADRSGEVYLSLVIRSGAIDESDAQRGASFIAKQAAGIDQPGIDPERAERFRSGFNIGGPAFTQDGRGHSAVSHAIVEYRLVFDASDRDAWSDAMGHSASMLGGWRPSDRAIAAARRITSEREPPDSPTARARAAIARSLFRGHPIGERPVLPGPDAAASITPEAIRAYVTSRYRPDAAVLIIVGDVNPGLVIDHASRVFADIESAPPKTAPNAGSQSLDVSMLSGRIASHVIEGYDSGELSLISFVGDDSRDHQHPYDGVLLDRLAAILVGNRIRREIAGIEPDLLSVDGYGVGWMRRSRLAEISIRSEPVGMINAARTLGGSLARMRATGWTRDEFQAARAELLEGLQADIIKSDGFAPNRTIASLVAAVMHGQPWIAPVAMHDRGVRVLASTTDDAIAARAVGLFDPETANVVIITPEESEGLNERLGSVVLKLAAGAASPAPGGDALTGLTFGETPGRIDQISHDPRSDVWTAMLSNGVLVRARSMPDPPGAARFDPYARAIDPENDAPGERAGVTVRAALLDGAVGEDARTAGRTREAVAAWRYAALSPGGAPRLREWMRARGLSANVLESQHRLVLEVSGPPGSSRDALTLAAAMLNRPTIDERFLDRVQIDESLTTAGLSRLSEILIGDNDPRVSLGPPSEGANAARATAWLQRLTRAPIECSIVGAFDSEDIIEMASETLGTLSMRERPGRLSNAWQPLKRSERSVRIEGEGETGEFVRGIVFADMRDLEKIRPMVIASRVLNAELRRRCKEVGGGGGAWIWLGEGIPDRVTFVTRVVGGVDVIENADAIVEEAITATLDGGISNELIVAEIDRVKQSVDRAWDRRSFWANRLSALSWNGLDVGALSGLLEAYGSITPAMVRETLAAAVGGGVHQHITVLPADGAE